MISYLASVRRIAENTPESRNRVVDLMRVVSILVVVLGHWLMAAVVIQNGELIPGHLLQLTDWTHPLTWVFQVMPIFFFVGGYANGLSWRSARRRGEPYGAWLRTRLRRLGIPVIPLLIVWAAGGWLGLRLGLPWETLQLASQVAIVPTWFLAAYVVIVTLAPVALALWEKYGWLSIVGGLVAAGLADIISLGAGIVPIGFLNYVFVWGTVHQLGYAWLDDRVGGQAQRAALAATGLIATLLLVWLGPFPIAMVGVDPTQVTNTYPPRVTLAFLGMFQAGLVLVAEPLLRRITQRLGVWMFVVAVSAQIMTLYLWHLTAMVIVIGLGLLIDGFGFGLEPLTPTWWLSRPLWFAVLAVFTIALIAIFGRFERPTPDTRPPPAAWRPVLAMALLCAGLGLLAGLGIADENGLNGVILSLPIVGMIVGGIVGAPWDRRTAAV